MNSYIVWIYPGAQPFQDYVRADSEEQAIKIVRKRWGNFCYITTNPDEEEEEE